MNKAIFRSTSQALHFAYLIEAYEVSIESSMARAMRTLMTNLGTWQDKEPSSIDFGDLNPLEVRAQCAMIRAAVKDRLPDPEAWVIQAHYGINDINKTDDGHRKPVFSRGRYEAIIHLANWLAPFFPRLNPMALDLLVARAVDNRVVDVTLRQMAAQFGLAHNTFHYALKRVKDKLYALEELAIQRLEPSFVAEGLVQEPVQEPHGKSKGAIAHAHR